MVDDYLSAVETADLRRSGTSSARLKFALGRDRFLEAAPKLPGGRYTNTNEVGWTSPTKGWAEDDPLTDTNPLKKLMADSRRQNPQGPRKKKAPGPQWTRELFEERFVTHGW